MGVFQAGTHAAARQVVPLFTGATLASVVVITTQRNGTGTGVAILDQFHNGCCFADFPAQPRVFVELGFGENATHDVRILRWIDRRRIGKAFGQICAFNIAAVDEVFHHIIPRDRHFSIDIVQFLAADALDGLHHGDGIVLIQNGGQVAHVHQPRNIARAVNLGGAYLRIDQAHGRHGVAATF